MLRDADPAIRAAACRCAPRTTAVAALLVSLLDDLHPSVAGEAAMALGRRGRMEGRPLLLERLRRNPDAGLIEAVAALADDECTVLIGRIARQRPELRAASLAALDAIDTPRSVAVLETLAARDESQEAG